MSLSALCPRHLFVFFFFFFFSLVSVVLFSVSLCLSVSLRPVCIVRSLHPNTQRQTDLCPSFLLSLSPSLSPSFSVSLSRLLSLTLPLCISRSLLLSLRGFSICCCRTAQLLSRVASMSLE